MYFRICWLDKRYRLAAYATLLIAISVLATLPAGLEFHEGRWVRMKITTSEQVLQIWQTGTDHILKALLILLLFIAADLGALGLGNDSTRRSLDFLLTRPRSRGHFLWTAWTAGISELVPLLVLPVLTSLAVLFSLTHAFLPAELLRMSVPLFAIAAVMYTLAFVFAGIANSPRSGYELAALILVVYWGVHYAQDMWWLVDSTAPYVFAAFDWYLTPHQLFPGANLVFLLAATLALPFLAQRSFSRREF